MQLIKGSNTKVIFSLLEQKENKNNECFVGDFFYEFNHKLNSFREVLIRQKIGYPYNVRSTQNRGLFVKILQLIARENKKIQATNFLIPTETEFIRMNSTNRTIVPQLATSTNVPSSMQSITNTIIALHDAPSYIDSDLRSNWEIL